MQLLTDPWQTLEHATQAQFANLKLEAAVKVAVKELHAINMGTSEDTISCSGRGLMARTVLFLLVVKQCRLLKD